MGSLTGAVSSKRITEESKGYLSAVGNRTRSVKAYGNLTVRPTGRAGTKVGFSDPAVECGIAVAQRIKGTPGITGLSPPRVRKRALLKSNLKANKWLKSVEPMNFGVIPRERLLIVEIVSKTFYELHLGLLQL